MEVIEQYVGIKFFSNIINPNSYIRRMLFVLAQGIFLERGCNTIWGAVTGMFGNIFVNIQLESHGY